MILDLGASANKAPASTNALVKESDTQHFVADVIEGSRTAAVIVDFWAPWCGPCKQLGPLLEKHVAQAGGAVRMVKVNVDENQELAQQMRIQSIPAVYAFFQGRPVDGFVGAVPESQIKAFVSRLAQMAKGDGGEEGGFGLEEALAEAETSLTNGDLETAMAIFGEVLANDPNHAVARAGVARCLIAQGDLQQARALIDEAPEEIAKDPAFAQVRSALDLAEQGAKAQGATAELRRKLAQNADDHAARFDLAMAYYAGNEREAAVDELLEIVRRNRGWNEEAARKQLVKLFEAFGPKDALTIDARKRLSSMLFS